MRNIVLIFTLLSFCACSSKLSQGIASQNLTDILWTQIKTNKSEVEKIPLYLSLSKLAINEQIANELIALNKNEKNNFDAFLQNYLLANQLQENKYIDRFVATYPEGQALKNLNGFVFDSDYKTVGSPFEEVLANYAISNDKALGKLVASANIVDASFATTWEENIKTLYGYNPKRVEKMFAQKGLDIAKHCSFIDGPTNGIPRSGKPSNEDVVRMAMENQAVLLEGLTECDISWDGKEVRTIGEYLSLGLEDYVNQEHDNFFHIKVEEGTDKNIAEKHWWIIYMINAGTGDEVYAVGLSFMASDKNQKVYKNTIQCITLP